MRFLYPGGGVSDVAGIITAPNHKGVPSGIKSGLVWAGDLGALQGPDYVNEADQTDSAEKS